jgi:hypothetical protein
MRLDSSRTTTRRPPRGPNKNVVWSFPIIRNGLACAVNVRNTLFLLRYTDPKLLRGVGVR